MARTDPDPANLQRFAVVFWCGAFGAIVIGSLTPEPPSAEHGNLVWLHLLAYAVLSSLTWPAFSIWRGPLLFVAISILAAFGTVIEFAQPFVGRVFSPADAVANAIGVIVGVPIGRLIRRYWPA